MPPAAKSCAAYFVSRLWQLRERSNWVDDGNLKLGAWDLKVPWRNPLRAEQNLHQEPSLPTRSDAVASSRISDVLMEDACKKFTDVCFRQYFNLSLFVWLFQIFLSLISGIDPFCSSFWICISPPKHSKQRSVKVRLITVLCIFSAPARNLIFLSLLFNRFWSSSICSS